VILPNELIVDAFCGGGGASEGIRRACGRSPDIAINHDEDAIIMHEANHPETRHLRESIWTVDPHAVTKGAPVGLMWASPDCTHFSRAKGGKPVQRRRRSLANVIVKWARDVSPRIICVENVPEFKTWGPLGLDNKPIKARSGAYFMRWKKSLQRLGYVVEDQILNAADYGAPTTRKRLFIVARRDGVPIKFPAKTHGKGTNKPWRAVAECIDWNIPCPSIFERKKPLAEATLKRIARGIMKYVVNDKNPFIVNLTHGGRLEDITEPAKTITCAHRGEKAVVSPEIAPFLTEHAQASSQRNFGADEPMRTLCAGVKGGHFAAVAPSLARIGNGEREGQAPRTEDIQKPASTVVGSQKHGLAVAHLLKHFTTTSDNLDARSPAATITTQDHHAVTVTKLAAHGIKLYGTATGQKVEDPAHTITGQGLHAGLIAAFLQEYYGNGNPLPAGSPIPTIVTKDRVAVVTVEIQGQTYAIVDIGMRMLKPRELARAQGFQDDYHLTGTQTNQVAKIGNSVVPHCAEAIVRSQLGTSPSEEIQPELFREAA
jgi:DNA (cytosine-5)-methyltransferase 1